MTYSHKCTFYCTFSKWSRWLHIYLGLPLRTAIHCMYLCSADTGCFWSFIFIYNLCHFIFIYFLSIFILCACKRQAPCSFMVPMGWDKLSALSNKFLYVCMYMSVRCMQAQFHLVIFFLFMLTLVVTGENCLLYFVQRWLAVPTGLKSSKYIPKKGVCEFPHTLLMKALSAAKTCRRAASDWPTLRNVR